MLKLQYYWDVTLFGVSGILRTLINFEQPIHTTVGMTPNQNHVSLAPPFSSPFKTKIAIPKLQ